MRNMVISLKTLNLKKLLESEYLKDYNESEIIQFSNSLKQFQLDNNKY